MKSLITGCCLLLLAQVVHADATLHYTQDGICASVADSVEISGAKMRFDTRIDGQPVSSLFDGDEDLLTALMPAERTYHQVEVDEDAVDYTHDVSTSTTVFMDRQMAQVSESLQAQCAQMQKQSKGFDCSQMLDIQGLMKSVMPANVQQTVTDTGRDERIGGVPCHWREWTQDGRKTREQCDAAVTALPVPDADRRSLARGLKVIQRYGDSFSAMRDRAGGGGGEIDLQKDQMPIAATCFDAGGQPVGHVRLDIATGPIDPQRLVIPAGYAPMMQNDPP